MRILAVDPGGTTGFTLWRAPLTHPENEIQAWMDEDPLHAVDTVYDYCTREGLSAIVCEDFIIGAGTIKKSREGSNTAIELIGTLRWLAYRWQIPFKTQLPSDAKFADDRKLKTLGWYTPGPDHARSSTRHLVVYLLDHHLLDPARLLPSTTASP